MNVNSDANWDKIIAAIVGLAGLIISGFALWATIHFANKVNELSKVANEIALSRLSDDERKKIYEKITKAGKGKKVNKVEQEMVEKGEVKTLDAVERFEEEDKHKSNWFMRLFQKKN